MIDRIIQLEKSVSLAVKEKEIAEAMYRVAISERNYERALVNRLTEELEQLRHDMTQARRNGM